MAWLSRLPKRRVVSGLDLDEEDLTASASGLCPKRDSRPSVASEPSAVVRRRRRVVEEETVTRTQAFPAAVPPSQGPLPEESPERPVTRQPPRVESVRRRRSSELSISEESGRLAFPDRPPTLEPTEAVGTRRRLRQSISEESLILESLSVAERPTALESTAEAGILPAAVPASEGPLPEESPERPVTRQPPRVESVRRRRSSELSISEDQPASRNPDSAAGPTPCRRRWARRVKRRQAAREATEEAEHLIDVIGLSERPQEDESAPRRMAISQEEPSSSRRPVAAETIEIPDTQPDPHELHEISESEDWSPARLGRAVRLPPPMVWPFGLPWQNDAALAAARAATARMDALAGQAIPGQDLAMGQLLQMQILQEISSDLRRGRERLINDLTTLTRNMRSRQGLPDAIPELRQALGFAPRGGAAQMRRGLEGREFTADDYETLLQLDAPAASHGRDDVEIQSLISVLPSSKLPAGAASRDCMVCMDQMQAGQEVKTLPCMHVFHSECIDRWLRESRNRPRCPIDQEDVRLD